MGGQERKERLEMSRRRDRSDSITSEDGTKRVKSAAAMGEPPAAVAVSKEAEANAPWAYSSAALNPMANPALAAILNKLSAAPPPPPPPLYAPPAYTATIGHPALYMSLGSAPTQKEAKELFVGNMTATGVSDVVLKDFLNAAMRQVGLTTGPGEAITGVRMNSKFCFLEMRSVQDCDRALNLNGIPFMGSTLKITRPAKYSGPATPCRTWQEMIGQAPPSASSGLSVSISAPTSDPTTKVFREIFVGNTTPEMTESSLRDFVGGALQKMGLSSFDAESPIAAVRVNAKFSFLEFKSIEDAANVLNLNGIPFVGVPLKISRPAKFDIHCTGSFYNWDDLLSRWMTGELKLLTGGPTSRTLCITNMVSQDDLSNQELFDEMIEDTKEECSTFGIVQAVTVPRPGAVGAPPTKGLGRLFVEMSTEEEAKAVLVALKGRTFDGRTVDVKFYPQQAFSVGEYGLAFPPMIVTTTGLMTTEMFFPTRQM